MDVLDNRDDMPRKRARMEEYHDDYEMDLDQDLDLDESLVVEAGLEEARWIAVDEYGLPLLGFAPTDHSGSSTFVGLSRYAIDVDSIVRQGFGDGYLMHQSAWTCTKDSDPVVPSSVLLTRASQILIIFRETCLWRYDLPFPQSRHRGSSLRMKFQ